MSSATLGKVASTATPHVYSGIPTCPRMNFASFTPRRPAVLHNPIRNWRCAVKATCQDTMNRKTGTRRPTRHRTHDTTRVVVPTFGNHAYRKGSRFQSWREEPAYRERMTSMTKTNSEYQQPWRKHPGAEDGDEPLYSSGNTQTPSDVKQCEEDVSSTSSSSSSAFPPSSAAPALERKGKRARHHRRLRLPTPPERARRESACISFFYACFFAFSFLFSSTLSKRVSRTRKATKAVSYFASKVREDHLRHKTNLTIHSPRKRVFCPCFVQRVFSCTPLPPALASFCSLGRRAAPPLFAHTV